MSPQGDLYTRWGVIFLQLYCTGMLGYIAYQVRDYLTFWQGLTRAGLMLYLLAGAYGTMTLIFGIDPSTQIMLRTVALLAVAIGLTMTVIDNRRNPGDGERHQNAG